jgi:hypothetical protein
MGTSSRRRTIAPFTLSSVKDVWSKASGKWVRIGQTKTNSVSEGNQYTISTGTLFPRLDGYYKRQIAAGQGRPRTINQGSNFYTAKTYVEGGSRRYYRNDVSATTYTDGIFDCIPLSFSSSELAVLPPLTTSELATLEALGATAIAHCIPTNPVSGLANFLGELKRDGIPSVPGAHTLESVKRGLPHQGAASDYLNYQFAVKPTLSDIRSFAQVVKDHEKILTQLQRDSGKGIRRRYRFPTIRTVVHGTDLTGKTPVAGLLPTSWFGATGVVKTETVTTVDRWFSGEFCYYLNLGDSITDKLKRHTAEANKLLGVRLTPELAWNLAPWSWAADWVTNAGDIFHNVSAFQSDGLVMRYGYIMEHTTVIKTMTLSGFSISGSTTGSFAPISLRFVKERKVRRGASPWGFGLTDTDFSPRQLAIIAALGITRTAGIAK